MLQPMQTGFHLVEPASVKIQIYSFGTLQVVRDALRSRKVTGTPGRRVNYSKFC